MGYQSYTQDKERLFPERSEAQRMLQQLADMGFTKEAQYGSKSQNGMAIPSGQGLITT